MTPRVITALALAIAASAWLAPAASAALHLSEIAGFQEPVYVTAPPGDPHRLFAVERQGRVMEVLDGVKLPTPFLDIGSSVALTVTARDAAGNESVGTRTLRGVNY
jgi:hypothetical protein